jgi:hypothetical protein
VAAGATATSGGQVPAGTHGSEAGADRTRNGLVKRVPRTRSVQHEPAAADRADRPAGVDRGPADMRTRLTSLRAGVQRGENARARKAGEAHSTLDHRVDGDKGNHDG